MIELTCRICNKRFKRHPFRVKESVENFCSNECRSIAYKKHNFYEKKDNQIIVDVIDDNKNIQKCLIDLQDEPLLQEHYWICRIDRRTKYKSIKAYCGKNRKYVALSRLIMDCPNGLEVDHINRDTLDNRRLNLRICDRSTNCLNKGISSKNNSGVTGVYFHSRDKKWIAKIKINGKTLWLGSFDDKEQAIIVRKEAEKTYALTQKLVAEGVLSKEEVRVCLNGK